VFGGSDRLLPPLAAGAAPGSGQVAVGRRLAADDGLGVGAAVTVGSQRLTVSGITDDRSYAHAPTVWTSEPTWQRISGQDRPTVLAVRPGGAGTAALDQLDQLDQAQNTRAVSRAAATDGIDGYAAEQGSLTMIQGFLLVISALVVGAFFTVWTVQRGPDIAVLKAIGASSVSLLGDAIGQAAVLLALGTSVGAASGLVGGAVLSGAGTPFAVTAATVAVPFAAMLGLGLLGAALAVRRIVSVDPLTALGAHR
jgi:putative ABC transport system permease protein